MHVYDKVQHYARFHAQDVIFYNVQRLNPTTAHTNHFLTEVIYLGVEHHGHVLVAAGGERLPEAPEGRGVPLVVPVAEVEASHVHAGVDQSSKGLHAPASGADSADDLALPLGLITLREDLVLAVFIPIFGR